MSDSAEPSRFPSRFGARARAVRGRLVLRRALTGLALGMGLAGLVAAALWWQRLGPERPWAAALGVLGALAGAAFAWRRRWSDGDVALYLDARLDGKEAISTAVGLEVTDGGAARKILGDAVSVLESADAKRARPRVLRRVHGLAPVGGLAIAYLSFIPLPPAPPGPEAPPGSELVQMANLLGLEKIEALDKLDPRDAEQRARLEGIARDAQKLREDLSKGLEKREAQARIAKLRDDIAAERMKLGTEENRPGLEAAVGKLNQSPHLKDAAKALGNGDLVEFDKEMQKLANMAETEAREAAKEAIEEAARAAREKGAGQLAEALEEQKRLFEQREGRAEALRQLARELGDAGKLSDEALEDLKEFGESGSPEAQKRLADALNDALEGLSEEERKRLAERLKKQLEQQGESGQMNPMTKQQLEDLAKKLATPEGQEQLRQQLKELAKEQASQEAEREKGLGDADRGGAEAERGLGMTPIPMQAPGGDGQQGPGNAGKNPGQGGDTKGQGGPGSKRDTGQGDHQGETKSVPGKELRSKANAKVNPGAPMQGGTLGRAPARAGETANRAGTGALGDVAPEELSGVERSELPQEYREQVGRYFQP